MRSAFEWLVRAGRNLAPGRADDSLEQTVSFATGPWGLPPADQREHLAHNELEVSDGDSNG